LIKKLVFGGSSFVCVCVIGMMTTELYCRKVVGSWNIQLVLCSCWENV